MKKKLRGEEPPLQPTGGPTDWAIGHTPFYWVSNMMVGKAAPFPNPPKMKREWSAAKILGVKKPKSTLMSQVVAGASAIFGFLSGIPILGGLFAHAKKKIQGLIAKKVAKKKKLPPVRGFSCCSRPRVCMVEAIVAAITYVTEPAI